MVNAKLEVVNLAWCAGESGTFLKTLVAGVSAVATVLLATPAVVQAEPGILHPIEMINCRPGCQEKLAQNKDRVQLFNVWSPKMERDVPIVVQPA